MELVNFSREDLGTVITSSCVFDDNHPPSNLISTKQLLHSVGYRAEHFIRPPVELTLEFAVPIIIESVCIQLSQLSVHSTTADLFLPRTNFPVKICGGIILKGNSLTRLINRGLSLDDWIKPQTALGSFLQAKKEEGKLSNTHNLKAVNSLQLRIAHSTSYQSIAVRAFEVWGLFDHQRCNNDLLQRFTNVVKCWNQKSEGSKDAFVPLVYSAGQADNQPTQPLAHHSSTSVTDPATKSHAGNTGQSFSGEIPESFLDEITFDIMLVPMLLPSGHYVDQSTIDKFSSSENSWGRPSADPFTGVAFTSSVKPRFCAHVKAQIDNFLSKNRQLYSSRGRTAGNADQLEKHLLSRKRNLTNIYGDGDERPPERKRPG